MDSIRIHKVEDTATPAFPTVTVGGQAIAEQDIAQELQYHPATRIEEAWQAAAQSLVVRALLNRRAEELGITDEDEEARTATLLELELAAGSASEAQCRQYYEQNRARFKTPLLLVASHILLPAAPDNTQERDQQRELAEQLIAELQALPEGFEALAKRHSACPSSAQGGSLGQLSRGQTVSEFENQIWLLETGLCAHPVESRYGYHVVRIDERVEGKQLPYHMVAESIGHFLKEQSTRTELSHYLQSLSERFAVEGVPFESSNSAMLN